MTQEEKDLRPTQIIYNFDPEIAEEITNYGKKIMNSLIEENI
jgi:hypothetical protein